MDSTLGTTPPSPSPPPPVSPSKPTPPPPPAKHSNRGIWITVAIIAVFVVLGAALYGTFLGARFAPGLSFKINGPDTLIAGQSTVVSWDTSPENQTQYPSDKIEFCRGRLFGERCVTLNPDTTNDGEALVFVPAGLSPGAGYLRLTARDKPAVLGGRLLTNISGTRSATIVASGENTQSTIGPITVNSGIVGTISPTGPRVAVARGASHRIELPSPKTAKKIEICRGNGCQALVVSATGGAATINLPGSFPTGRAYIKVSERGQDGRLTGNVLYRRAILVEGGSPQTVATNNEDESDDNEESGGDDGDSSSASTNDSSATSTPTATPTAITPPTPTTVPAGGIAAEIIDPVDGALITGDQLTTSVKLTEPPGKQLTCHQWKIDGQLLVPGDWISGNSPDQSAPPCL